MIRLRSVIRSPSALLHILKSGTPTAASEALAPRGNATDYNHRSKFRPLTSPRSAEPSLGFTSAADNSATGRSAAHT